MRKRVKLVAPWWTQLTSAENTVALEKENGSVGDTGYGVYFDDERVGFVYSLKQENEAVWLIEGNDHVFMDRFGAVRMLVAMQQQQTA